MNQAIFNSLKEYREAVILLAKSYLSEYIISQEPAEEGSSTKLHLFQDTLLRKEVDNFLSSSFDIPIKNRKEYERQFYERAERSLKKGMFLPLEYLCRVFAVSPIERFCITLLAAAEMDTNFEKVYAYINNDWKRNTLSIELAIQMYQTADEGLEEYYSYFSDKSVLYRYFCDSKPIEKDYWLKSSLRLKPRILSFLIGSELDNEALMKYVSISDPEEKLDLMLTEDQPYQHMLNYLTSVRDKTMTVFYLYGNEGIGKKLNVKYFANNKKQPVYFLKLDKLPKEPDSGELLNEILLEVILKQGLLCICSIDKQLSEDKIEMELMNEILLYVRTLLPVLFVTSDCMKKATLKVDGVNVIAIGMEQHDLRKNNLFWKELAKEYSFASDIDLELLSNKFIRTPGQIKEIFCKSAQLALWYGQEQITLPILQKVCLEQIEHNLGKRAQKVRMIYSWEDLILPDYQKNMIKTACNQVKYKFKVMSQWGYDEKIAYGIGLSLIFSGPPGTGKTMGAQVMANELGLELYKIELASVVSKYIGETEQNLNEIFDEAKKSQGVIFFDEADVLFSKRTEVKDSNDKYSNMEAAFMLQKIEEYTGIVILATNYQQNIDEAFKRRIKYLIDFPSPDSNYRKMLWKKTFPARLPLSNDIDIDYLADKFELTGSNIKNIALNAAFLAAAEDSEVEMKHLIKSVVNEFTKSGKKLSKEELGEYYMYE